MEMYKVLESDSETISMFSEIFKPMLGSADAALQKVLNEVYAENFQGGEITIKLKVEIPEDYKEVPTLNVDGELIPKKYYYKTPAFDYKVSTTLNKKYKTDGCYRVNKEIEEEDGLFKLIPLKENQMQLDIKEG